MFVHLQHIWMARHSSWKGKKTVGVCWNRFGDTKIIDRNDDGFLNLRKFSGISTADDCLFLSLSHILCGSYQILRTKRNLRNIKSFEKSPLKWTAFVKSVKLQWTVIILLVKMVNKWAKTRTKLSERKHKWERTISKNNYFENGKLSGAHSIAVLFHRSGARQCCSVPDFAIIVVGVLFWSCGWCWICEMR